MNEPDLELYVDAGWLSPYALSAYVALVEKGLAFEVREVALEAGEHLVSPYWERSLTARVPMLRHGQLDLSESSAIAEYLEEVFPAPGYPALLPADRVDRARARQVQAWLRSDLLEIRQERPSTVLFGEREAAPLSASARSAAAKLFEVADALLGPHGDGVAGQWCIADTDLAIMLLRLVANGDPVPGALAAYARAQWMRPSVQGWVAQTRARRAGVAGAAPEMAAGLSTEIAPEMTPETTPETTPEMTTGTATDVPTDATTNAVPTR